MTGEPATGTNSRVKSVYIWRNGMAMVFAYDGKQIDELQGEATPELRAAIKARCDEDTEWTDDAAWEDVVNAADFRKYVANDRHFAHRCLVHGRGDAMVSEVTPGATDLLRRVEGQIDDILCGRHAGWDQALAKLRTDLRNALP